MNNNLTELVYILDVSGSMGYLRKDTIGGYNTMIEEQKKEPGEAVVTTVLFNDRHKTIVDRMNIKDVPAITEKEYFPCGMTAMYDAIGTTIDKIGKKLSETPEEERPGKVMFTIVTDGEENSSHEYGRTRIKEMIKEQRDKYSWVFVFIGANIDAENTGESIGIDKLLSKLYTASSRGTESVYRSMSMATTELRKGVSLSNCVSGQSSAKLDAVYASLNSIQ